MTHHPVQNMNLALQRFNLKLVHRKTSLGHLIGNAPANQASIGIPSCSRVFRGSSVRAVPRCPKPSGRGPESAGWAPWSPSAGEVTPHRPVAVNARSVRATGDRAPLPWRRAVPELQGHRAGHWSLPRATPAQPWDVTPSRAREPQGE